MRGKQNKQQSMIGLMNAADRIPKHHPLRRIKPLADEILRQMGPKFNAMYSKTGRPSIPPEQLLNGSLLMALYTIRSERQFCEQLNYNLLYRWFLDMEMLDETFDPTSFRKNRDRDDPRSRRQVLLACGRGGACSEPDQQ